jgi:hypothetical protein
VVFYVLLLVVELPKVVTTARGMFGYGLAPDAGFSSRRKPFLRLFVGSHFFDYFIISPQVLANFAVNYS